MPSWECPSTWWVSPRYSMETSLVRTNPRRNRLTATNASNSHQGDASPTAAQHSRQGADATAEPAWQDADQCPGRDLPATNRIRHIKHNRRLQIRVQQLVQHDAPTEEAKASRDLTRRSHKHRPTHLEELQHRLPSRRLQWPRQRRPSQSRRINA